MVVNFANKQIIYSHIDIHIHVYVSPPPQDSQKSGSMGKVSNLLN